MSPFATDPNVQKYLLPYQIRWICDDHAVAVAEKSRRIGWTYASAYRAVDRRLREGTNLFYTSADLSAAREFAEDCCRWARRFKSLAKLMDLEVVDEDEGITAFVLRFENGAKIVAGSSNPKFFRGKGGDADADEVAFHEQPRELYKAMQPASLVWGHQLRLWSTHNGAGSFFHKMVDRRGGAGASDNSGPRPEATASPADDSSSAACGFANQTCNPSSGPHPNPPPEYREREKESDSTDDDLVPITNQRVSIHRVTLIDAVSAGLVERIRNLPEPDLIARQDFIEEIRASCPDEAAFREEYLCEPNAEGAALLGYAAISACEAANLQLHDVDDLANEARAAGTDGKHPGPLFAGFDVGRRHDRSVLWVVERVGDVLWTRCLRVMGDTPFSVQEQLIDRLLAGRRVKRVCIDSTGMGAMLAERLRQRHHERVEPIHFTAEVKSELAMPLVRLFQDRLVRVPADAAVREDLHKVRRTVTAAHHVRLSAPRDADGHSDRFWSLALACHAAEQVRGAKYASAARKPPDW